MSRLFLTQRPRVVFIYSEPYLNRGSTVMRGQQLSELFKHHYGARYRIQYLPLSVNFKNSILFLTKCAIMDITPEQITLLRSKGNRVLLDFVDDPIDMEKAIAADAIIAASLEAYDDYKARGLHCYLLNHHVDPRIPRTHAYHESFRCGYFGELVNTVRTKHISELVDFIQVDTGKQKTSWFAQLPQYSCHYGVRADNVEAFKPFLKGFTAAMCGANIIIQRDQREAVKWLGNDYPFLLPANPTERDILAMISYAKEQYGTKTWQEGLKAMERVRAAISDDSITHQLHEILQSLV